MTSSPNWYFFCAFVGLVLGILAGMRDFGGRGR